MKFSIDPVVALLILERDNLLYDSIDELSPLRRPENASAQEPVAIMWDSRQCEDLLSQKAQSHQPVKMIFVAKKGLTFDGHTLVEDVLSSGNIFVGEPHVVDAFLRSQKCPPEWVSSVMAHPFFIKTRSAAQSLCRLLEVSSHIETEEFTSISITGTNGKTSVTQLTGQLLESIQKKPVLKMGTLGIQVGEETLEGKNPTMPDFPEMMSALVKTRERKGSSVVFEATSQGLEQGRLGNWLVDVAVFTNLTQDHLDYHKTMTNYRAAKGILLERHVKHGGTVVLNTNDPEWAFFASKGAHAVRNCIGVGDEKNKKKFFATVQGKYLSARFMVVSKRESRTDGLQGVWALYSETTKITEVNYSCSLIGGFQHDNLSYAAASLVALGYQLQQIAELATQVKSIRGRLELIQLPEPHENSLPTVLVDYAHSPDALEKAIQTCIQVRTKKSQKIYTVFGCGGDRDKAKRPLMGAVAAKLSDIVVLTSDNPRTERPQDILDDILTGIPERENVVIEVERAQAIEWAIANAQAGDVILIAGKGHEDYQIIGDVKTHFSDAEVAIQFLYKKNQK